MDQNLKQLKMPIDEMKDHFIDLIRSQAPLDRNVIEEMWKTFIKHEYQVITGDVPDESLYKIRNEG